MFPGANIRGSRRQPAELVSLASLQWMLQGFSKENKHSIIKDCLIRAVLIKFQSFPNFQVLGLATSCCSHL